MTIDWTGSAAARRIDALEREIAMLRDAAANPRLVQAVCQVDDLLQRLAALESRVAADESVIEEQAACLAANAKDAEKMLAELARLRVETIRLDREITRHEDETRKIATGLFSRIEHGRAEPSAIPPRPPST
jgi:uncharacterized coiled-coil protein SlyX